ncbi:MAG: RluA family pseudouridine synthase [Clostridia bacterium]|nr:RluA family pseudouridine synthase [Clostridia bacterium]
MTYTVGKERGGTRLDAFLAEDPALSRSAAARLIEDGAVLVNGRGERRSYLLREGDVVTLTLPEPVADVALPEDIPLSVVYEDEDIIVIDKPKGMVVHPAPGNPTGTLVNALLHHCHGSLSGIGGVERPGIVHRIDKETSGLLVAAKNDAAHRALAAALEVHDVHREYRALVTGGFASDEGTVDLPIGRHPVDRKRMAVLREGQGRAREAITHYRVLERFGGITYLALRLETGRTHQIRVHMSHLSHPLLGDTVYGGGRTPFERRHAHLLSGQCLHAAALTLPHPRTGEEMRFESPLPEEFLKLLSILREGQN